MVPKFTANSPEIIQRCGNPIPGPNSIICPHCGSPEIFCDKNDPN